MNTKVHILLSLLAFACPLSLRAGWFEYPALQMLIIQHKLIAESEDEAIAKISTSKLNQDEIKTKTFNFKEVQSTLHTQLNNAVAWITLAESLGRAKNNSKKLISLYKDFTSNTLTVIKEKNVLDKAMATKYYYGAITKANKDIKHISELLGLTAASGFNIMRSTMKEKLDLVNTVNFYISQAIYEINNAYYYIYALKGGYLHYDFIYELFFTNSSMASAAALMAEWDAKKN